MASSGVFIVNFEPISHLFLEFVLLTLNRYMFGEKVTDCECKYPRGQIPVQCSKKDKRIRSTNVVLESVLLTLNRTLKACSTLL